MNRRGKCIGVSVGPGAKEQITLEALETVRKADIIFLPTSPKEDCTAYKIIREIIPEIDEKEIMCETFTMARDASVLKERHQEIYDITVDLLDSGKNVAFLALGEVALFSTYIYIHERLLEGGYESELLPGISSVQAIAAKLKMPLASGGDNLHIFSDIENLPDKLALSGTKVFMKTRKNMEELITTIQNFVRANPGASAAGISKCGMPGEIVAWNAKELNKLEGYFTVIMVKDAPKSIKEKVEPFDYSYFENHSCKYYPCHEAEHINCLFCYCPMYFLDKCPGKPDYIEKEEGRIKVCTNCTFPHERENYSKIMKVLKGKIYDQK